MAGTVLVLDLVGTFVFAISAAVNRRLDIFGTLVLAFVAGNFGGIARDLLIGAVLCSNLYAVAALSGASIVVMGDRLGVSYGISALAGAALCFGLRFMAIRHGWHLPVARLSGRQRARNDSADNDKTC
jgi:uncharacterized membrane protein YeiH